MNNPIGQKVSSPPFVIENEIGTLLFEEYPSTVVFIDNEGRPIIREWVDGSKDGKLDRYFFFKTNVNNLRLFINGVISHRTFVRIAEGTLYYFEDISNEGIVVSKTIVLDFLPMGYYPGMTYISQEDVVDLVDIYEAFSSTDKDDSFNQVVKEIAMQENVETYNLHLKEGHGVGYGIVKTEVLGKSLISFDYLYQEASLDYLLRSSRGEVSKKKKRELEPFTSTELYRSLSASYSVLIRPKYSIEKQTIDGEAISSSSAISQKVFALINTSLSNELLNEKVKDYSPRLIEAFKGFMQNVKDSGLSISLSWYNPDSGIMHGEDISSEKASLIVGNIERLSIASEEPLTKTGKFDLLNCSTGHFAFSSNGESITGFFDKKIKEGIRLVNFVDTYTVSIIKKVTRIAGKPEPKIEHTLTAYYPDNVTTAN